MEGWSGQSGWAAARLFGIDCKTQYKRLTFSAPPGPFFDRHMDQFSGAIDI